MTYSILLKYDKLQISSSVAGKMIHIFLLFSLYWLKLYNNLTVSIQVIGWRHKLNVCWYQVKYSKKEPKISLRNKLTFVLTNNWYFEKLSRVVSPAIRLEKAFKVQEIVVFLHLLGHTLSETRHSSYIGPNAFSTGGGVGRAWRRRAREGRRWRQRS